MSLQRSTQPQASVLINISAELPPPSWALFPQGKRNTSRLTHSQGYYKIQPSQHSWVYQAAKALERLTPKLVRSTIELQTLALDLAWILKHLHTQHKETSPSLLHNPSGHALPFSSIQGVQRRKPFPVHLSLRFLLTLVLSSYFRPHFHSQTSSHQRKKCTHNIIQNYGLRKNSSATKQFTMMGKNNPLAAIQFPYLFMALMWPKWTQKNQKQFWVSSPTRWHYQQRFPSYKKWENVAKSWGRKPNR